MPHPGRKMPHPGRLMPKPGSSAPAAMKGGGQKCSGRLSPGRARCLTGLPGLMSPKGSSCPALPLFSGFSLCCQSPAAKMGPRELICGLSSEEAGRAPAFRGRSCSFCQRYPPRSRGRRQSCDQLEDTARSWSRWGGPGPARL